MNNIYFFWLFFFSNWLCSQNYSPLEQVLENIEKQHQVTFNYLKENIQNVFVIPVNKQWSLRQKIVFLSQNTPLNFEFLTDQIIIIKVKERPKWLCGYLVDVQQNPVSNATVRLSQRNLYAVSDEKGYFQMEVVSKETEVLEVNHLSFKSMKLIVAATDKNDCKTYVLEDQVAELEEVVAVEYIGRGIRKKSDGSVEIKAYNFGILPGMVETDVLQTLNQIPGFINSDETISNINVRGGTHDQNLFLWNHIKLYQTGHFFGMISAINPNLSNTISINKNATSAFLGEGVSSTVNISSHKKFEESSSAHVDFNLISTGLLARVNFQNKSLLTVSGRRSNTDFLNSITYQNYFKRVFQNTEIVNLANNQNIPITADSKFNFYDFTTQFQTQFGEKHQFYLDFLNFNNQLDFTEQTSSPTSSEVKNNQLIQKNIGASATWKTNWNAKVQSEFVAHFSMHDQLGYNENILNNQILNQSNQILDFGFKWKNKHQFSDQFTYNYGYQFNEVGIRNSDQINSPIFERTVKRVQNLHALVNEISLQTNRWFSSIGLRVNYADKFTQWYLEPRWNVKYRLNKKISIAVLGEIKNQFSSQIIDLQQDFFGLEKRRWILADETNIPVINSFQQSLNLDYSHQNWLVSAELFYKKVNGITSAAQGFQNQLEFQKITGNYQAYGLEFLVQKKMKYLIHWVNYSYNSTDYFFDGYIPPEFRNNFEIQHAITFASSAQWKKWKFSLGGKWFTGRPTTSLLSTTPIFNLPETPEISFDSPNNTNLKDYFQLNMSGSYQFDFNNKSNLLLGFSVQNITNRQNIINQFYRLNQDQIEEVQIRGLEFTPNVFLKYLLF